MELLSKILEQRAFDTRPRIEEHFLIVLDKSTHEEHLSQPLQTNNKQFKIAVTFLTGYDGIFIITKKNKKFYFKKSITDADEFRQIFLQPGADEKENLIKEASRNINIESQYSEENYPLKIKANFTTLGFITEILPPGPKIGFVSNDSIRTLSGFRETLLCQEYSLSHNPVDNLPFDNIFVETDNAQGMIFERKRSSINHNFAMDVDPG